MFENHDYSSQFNMFWFDHQVDFMKIANAQLPGSNHVFMKPNNSAHGDLLSDGILETTSSSVPVQAECICV